MPDDWRIPESDLYLFNHGELLRAWRHLGAHAVEGGWRFAVWAPYARRVAVKGTFSDWDGGRFPLEKRGDTGIWEGVVPGARRGDLYKYELVDSRGQVRDKSDPFGFRVEVRPKTASICWTIDDHEWGDADWIAARPERQASDRPLRIYEVHLGSWRKGRSYRQLAEELPAYAASMGFTHVELMPVTEYPYDASWGYQVCGYFAATSRFGEPQDLMALVDALHRAGIGVLVDWVPAHFPKDDHGLARFDGSNLYEHEDPRRGLHRDWDTLIFNYGRPEVRNFLWSSALFWLEAFHMDGLRVDAVASMLYRDYSREDGDWVPDEQGGNLDREAIAFLRDLNRIVHAQVPGALTIAEESTAYPGVTAPAGEDGLGFDLKWNMGWMHDSLDFFRRDPVHRKFHHDRLTFALYYAFKERFLLPLSHDEVVHLKGSLLHKMPGDDWQRYANLRLLHVWQAGHPGKSLLFMGGEFGQTGEWNHDATLEWGLLNDARHAGIRLLVGDLNRLFHDYPCLSELDHDWRGFEWCDFGDVQQSVISFVRWGRGGRDGGGNGLLFVLNFTPVVRADYRVGVPRPGGYREILNTDSACYGGSGIGNLGEVQTDPTESHGRPNSLSLTLPPLGAVVFEVSDTC